MNYYDKPLNNPIKQTILPAMTEDGLLRGWYPIDETFDTPLPAVFDVGDNEVPLKVVTVDTTAAVKQFVAAVWPAGLPANSAPWASAMLIEPSDGYYSWWSMPTAGWRLHFGEGVLIDGMHTNLGKLNTGGGEPSNPPAANPAELKWHASASNLMFNGACPFFDFNWVTLFGQVNSTNLLKSISVVSVPAATGTQTSPPFIAQIVGIPTAVPGAVGYVRNDTVRIIAAYPPNAGEYVFKFSITVEGSAPVDVEFKLTVLS